MSTVVWPHSQSQGKNMEKLLITSQVLQSDCPNKLLPKTDETSWDCPDMGASPARISKKLRQAGWCQVILRAGPRKADRHIVASILAQTCSLKAWYFCCLNCLNIPISIKTARDPRDPRGWCQGPQPFGPPLMCRTLRMARGQRGLVASSLDPSPKSMWSATFGPSIQWARSKQNAYTLAYVSDKLVYCCR